MPKSIQEKLINTLLDTKNILELVTENYSLGEVQNCSLIRRGFNDHYLITAGQAKYIFRVYLNGKYYVGSPEAFQFELDLLDYLRTQNIPVAYPIRMDNGELLGWTLTALGKRATALFPFAPDGGVTTESVTIEQILEVGKTTAAFHLAANDLSSNHERYHLNLKYLVDEPMRLIEKDNNEQGQELLASLPSIPDLVSAVKSLSIDNDEYGIIHGDLHPGNMHFQGDQVTLFDFDHCGYGWRAYDLAPFYYAPEAYQKAFFQGYEALRPLTQGERDCLPIFAKLRMLWDIGDMLATEELRASSSS